MSRTHLGYMDIKTELCAFRPLQEPNELYGTYEQRYLFYRYQLGYICDEFLDLSLERHQDNFILGLTKSEDIFQVVLEERDSVTSTKKNRYKGGNFLSTIGKIIHQYGLENLPVKTSQFSTRKLNRY